MKKRRPQGFKVGNETFRLVVLQITKRENGVPRTFRMIAPEETINLKGGEEFLTAYVHESAFGN